MSVVGQYGGMTCAEVALALDMSPTMVRSIEQAALSKLRYRMQKQHRRLSDFVANHQRGGMNDHPFDGVEAPEIES